MCLCYWGAVWWLCHLWNIDSTYTSSVSSSEVDFFPFSSWTTFCQHSELQLHTAFSLSSDLITVCIVPSKPHCRCKAICFFIHIRWNSCLFHSLLLAAGAQCFTPERPLFIITVSGPFSRNHRVTRWSLIVSSIAQFKAAGGATWHLPERAIWSVPLQVSYTH